jgi:hypothetical protein
VAVMDLNLARYSFLAPVNNLHVRARGTSGIIGVEGENVLANGPDRPGACRLQPPCYSGQKLEGVGLVNIALVINHDFRQILTGQDRIKVTRG